MRRTIKKWAIGFGLAYLILLVPLPIDSPALFYVRLALLVAVTALLLMVASALLTEIRIQRLYAEPPDGAGPYATIRYGDIDVCFQWRLDGGGTVFSHEYIRLVAEKFGKVDHVFEFCCGPGFIGFSLLAHGLCERLTLADVSRRALDAVRETIRRNGLEDRVTVHHSDALDGIPAGERWDLVVGNPPWLLAPPNARNLLLSDPDGQVHKSFYRDVGKFLAPGGSVLLIEGGKYTEPGDFQPMLDQNGLQVDRRHPPGTLVGDPAQSRRLPLAPPAVPDVPAPLPLRAQGVLRVGEAKGGGLGPGTGLNGRSREGDRDDAEKSRTARARGRARHPRLDDRHDAERPGREAGRARLHRLQDRLGRDDPLRDRPLAGRGAGGARAGQRALRPLRPRGV